MGPFVHQFRHSDQNVRPWCSPRLEFYASLWCRPWYTACRLLVCLLRLHVVNRKASYHTLHLLHRICCQRQHPTLTLRGFFSVCWNLTSDKRNKLMKASKSVFSRSTVNTIPDILYYCLKCSTLISVSAEYYCVMLV